MTDAPAIGKLKPDVKAQWLAALRSGEYRQGNGYLHYRDGDTDHFCCLGVLCDLAAKAGIVEEVDAELDEDPNLPVVYVYAYGQGSRYDLPGKPVYDWAFEKLPQAGMTWLVSHTGDSLRALYELNDVERLTFEEIADRIDADL